MLKIIWKKFEITCDTADEVIALIRHINRLPTPEYDGLGVA